MENLLCLSRWTYLLRCTDILWIESSKLKLIVDKTDLIITGTKQQRNKTVDYFPVKILGNDTSPSQTVQNLGVVFDRTFQKYANHVSIIYVISVESGIFCLYLLLKQYQLLWFIVTELL